MTLLCVCRIIGLCVCMCVSYRCICVCARYTYVCSFLFFLKGSKACVFCSRRKLPFKAPCHYSSRTSWIPEKLATTRWKNIRPPRKGSKFHIALFPKPLKTNWSFLIPPSHILPQPNYQVYILDARNHGDSPHSKDMSYEHMAKDVMRLWEDHGIRKSVLLGHSMGGKTAMVTSLLYPDLVEQLVVVDVAPTTYSGALGGDSMDKLVSILAGLPLASIKSRADADELLKVDVPVSRPLGWKWGPGQACYVILLST